MGFSFVSILGQVIRPISVTAFVLLTTMQLLSSPSSWHKDLRSISRLPTEHQTSNTSRANGFFALGVKDHISTSVSSYFSRQLEKPNHIAIDDYSFYNDTNSRLHNLNIAFLGDSLTRYQYLSLVHYIERGTWVESSDRPNILGNPRQAKVKNGTLRSFESSLFDGHEECNCFRPPGKIDLSTSYQNRYYADNERHNYLRYFTKVGSPPAHGHWDPSAVHDINHRDMITAPSNSSHFRWSYNNWTDLIRDHVAQLVPKPRYVVLNAGVWRRFNDLSTTTLREIRTALDETGIVGIYKTTTRLSMEKRTTLDSHDSDGCAILHLCLNLSWTGQLDRTNYWDIAHFNAPVYTKFNLQLLDLLRGIERKAEDKENSAPQRLRTGLSLS